MALSPDDLKDIDARIANQLEAEQIVQIFHSMDERDKEKIALDISRFMYDRQQALRSPDNPYTPRFMVEGQDINYATVTEPGIGAQVGHQGPTLPRIVNFTGGAQGTLDPRNGEQLNLKIQAGGTDCMFDAIASTCWATEVAAGRGSEGQVFKSLSGCDFRVYSTLSGAVAGMIALGAGYKKILLCNSETITASISLTGIAAIRVFGLGSNPIGSTAHTSGSPVILTQGTTLVPMFTKAGSGGGQNGNGIGFQGIGFVATDEHPFNFSNMSSFDWMEFEDCYFDTPNKAIVGATTNLGMDMKVSNCQGNISSYSFTTGLFAGPDNLYAFNNIFVMTHFWGNDNNRGSPDRAWFEGGRHSVSATTTLTGVNDIFQMREMTIESTAVCFTTNTVTGSQKNFVFQNITVIATGDSCKFGDFGSPTTNANQGLFIDGVYGYPAEGSGVNPSGAFITVDADWTDVFIGSIGQYGWTSTYSGPIPATPPVGAAPYDAQYLTLATDTDLSSERVFTPFSTSLIAVDGGAGSTYTLRARSIRDLDNDSYVDVEVSADSDVIESATGGTIYSRLSALGLQLANGADLTLYSDAFTTPKAFVDGATGRAAFGDDDTSFVQGGSTINSRLNSHTDTVGESLQVLGYHSSTNPSTVGHRQFFIRSRGTLASSTAVATNDLIGETYFAGHDGTDYEVGALIQAAVDNTVSAGVVPGRLLLSTASAAGTMTERFRLNSTGVWVATSARDRWPITAKTIATDQITIASGDTGHYTLAGEGGVADSLDGIIGGTQGDILILSPVSDTVTITITHNDAGGSSGAKIFTSSGSSIALDDIHDCVMFIYKTALDSGAGGWMQVGGSGGGSGASDAADLTYTPADNNDWGGSDPGDTDNALDVLADRGSKGREVIYAARFRGNIFRTSPTDPPEVLDTGSEDNLHSGIPFPNSGTSYAAAEFKLPINYKDGAAFAVTFIWTALAGSGNMEWGVQAVALRHDSTLNTNMTSSVVQTGAQALTATNDLQFQGPLALTPANSPVGGDWILIEVIRVSTAGNDTLSATAYLKAIEIIWNTDAGGYA